MRVFGVLVVLALGACAGEWGVRLEAPGPGQAWLGQDWTFGGMTFSARAEAQLLPLGFRRGTLGLSGSGAPVSWKLEGILLGTGRMDAFLSASFSKSLTAGPAVVRLAAGGKGGWAALNLAPLWLGTGWVSGEAEAGDWRGKLQWEGPPSAWTLRVSAPSFALTLGPALALELWQNFGPWTASTQIQIGPRPGQRVAVAWASEQGTARIWLDLEGGGLLFASSGGSQSLLFSLLWGSGLQGTLEITRAF